MHSLKSFTRYALVVFLVAAAAAGCSDDDGPSEVGVAKTAEEFLKTRHFQGSVLIKRGGETVLNRGFGYANRTAEVFNDSATKFRVGSVTKSFTAVAVVQLKKQGLITSFDQTVADFFPDLPRGDEITIRHLLTHESGLPDYLGFVDQESSYEPEELVEAVIDEPLHFTPGEYVEYSNTNYAALGVLVEALTETDYMSYLQATVLDPLGMADTEYGSDPIVGVRYARGYNGNVAADAIDMSVPYAAGALVSTPGDLGFWAEMMLTGSFLDANDRAEIFPEAYPQPGVNVMGMGWFVLNTGDQIVYHHGGDIGGFTSLVALFPEENGYVVLLSNVQDQQVLRGELIGHLIANGLK